MSAFHAAHARGETWQECVARCTGRLGRPGGGLGFVYFTEALVPHAAPIVETLREKTGVSDWIGTVGIGIIASGTEYLDEPALSVMVAGAVRGPVPDILRARAARRRRAGAFWRDSRRPEDPGRRRADRGHVLQGRKRIPCRRPVQLARGRGAGRQRGDFRRAVRRGALRLGRRQHAPHAGMRRAAGEIPRDRMRSQRHTHARRPAGARGHERSDRRGACPRPAPGGAFHPRRPAGGRIRPGRLPGAQPGGYRL